jgi:lipase
LETLDALDLQRITLIGHSFGGRVAAAIAARVPECAARIALLDPALEIPAERALASAEIDRLDWSFGSVDGAVNALLGSDAVVAAPRDTVAAYASADLQHGADGLLRFRYCPSAAVVLWSEAALPAPPIAQLPTLLVRPVASYIDGRAQDRRYRRELGSLLTVAAVPNGHNLLWDSPEETAAAIQSFLADT